MEVKLNRRQQHVLWATVRHYVATAEPVGSKSLVEEFNLKVSPATIRSSMGVLEKVGLLYQPHPSAGRVPSDSGYRLYVDRLMTPSEALATQVDRLLGETLGEENCSLEALIQGAAQLLANLSGYITLITLPQTGRDRLHHVQFVPIDAARVMLIVVTDAYQTHSTIAQLSQLSDRDGSDEDAALDPERLERELQILSNFLNAQLRGKALSDIPELDWSELDRQFQSYADALRQLLSDLTRRLQGPSYTGILTSGLAELLRQPEFTELSQVQTLIQLLEDDRELLWPLLVETLPSDPSRQDTLRDRVDFPVNVCIGSENPLEPIRACTLISTTYNRGSVPVGSVGILGPTRMVYENAIAMVKATADYLSEAIAQSA